MVHSIVLKFEKIWLSHALNIIRKPKMSLFSKSHKIQVKFDYGVFQVMALFLLENNDFLGFQMIFKVQLNQIFSNFNTMQCTIKYRLNSIMVKLTFTAQHCVKVWKDLVERYFKYHSET
jgi:hypothetical protein